MRLRFRYLLPALVLLAAFAVGGCAAYETAGMTNGHSQRRLTLTGSSTIAPLLNEIGKRFEQRHPEVRVDVQTGGSSRGIADARAGLADIGMVSRALTREESDLHSFTVARDGVCLILHAGNAVSSLSNEQVVKIYTGQIENWREVGGADARITVVNKAEGRSTLELFVAHFKLDTREIQAHVVIGDNEQGIKTVAGNPHSIGYVSIGTAEYDRESGVPIKLLPIDGVEASVANIANGRFPLSRPLNLVTKSPPEGLVEEFIKFSQSSEVHDLVQELSFVPVQ